MNYERYKVILKPNLIQPCTLNFLPSFSLAFLAGCLTLFSERNVCNEIQLEPEL